MGTALQTLTQYLFGAVGGEDGVIEVVFDWLTSASVLPYFAIGIGCSLALFGVKVIRSVVWGS